ncbi:MAG: PAS domain S-box protein [Steroidobacteraceae bacterium]|nr:PAS domain S-box protein [Deltaproteobacteria bacterium]
MDELISNHSDASCDAGFQKLAALALESAQDEILWADAGGRLIYANRSACSALEYSRAELLSMTMSDICPDLPPLVWAEQWQELKAAGHMLLEVRQRSRSGRYTLVEVTTTYMQHDGQEYSCAFVRDIADRKAAEHELSEAKQRLDTIFDTMQAGILMGSPQGIITFANHRMADMFGCSLDELIGSSYFEHVYPAQRQVGDERMRRLVAGEIDHVHHEQHFIRRDGSDFWGHLSGRRLEDAQGNMISLVGVIADISEIKQVEEELKKREQQFSSLADNLPDVVSRIDRTHRHVYVNRQVEVISGIPVSEYLGKTNRELGVPPELVELWEDAVTQAFDTGEIVRIRFALPTEAGMKHFESRIVPERGADGAVETVLCIARDTTEAVLAEQQLKASENKFVRAFNRAPVLMTISNIEDGRYLEVNDRFCEISGFSRQEALGRTSLELGWLSPAERERMIAVFKHDGRIGDMEIALTAKDGTPVYCLYSAEMITAEGEDQLLSIALDITGRKYDLEALAYANQCFTQALNGSQHILYRLNVKKGCYDYLSPAFEKSSGYPVADFMKNSFEQLLEYFHPDDRSRIFGYIDEAFRTRTGPNVDLDMEYRFRKADGCYSWVQDVNTACFNDQGELECFFGSALDITERKRSEEKIRQQAQLLELAHDSIIVRDEHDRIIFWNRGAEECYGWKSAEVLGQVIYTLFKTCFPIPLEEIQLFLVQNGMWQGELIHTRRDGIRITVSSKWSRICNDLDGSTAVLEINRDISDRLLLQQEQEKNQRLEALGVLAGGIAHDFNNILTAILGNISLARLLVGGEHKAAQRLADSEKAAIRASGLTQQLLTFARGGEPVKQVVDTLKLIGEAVGFALQGANVKGVIEAESGLYPVNADEGQLCQVFSNLLINAKQAMPDGGTVIVTAKNLKVRSGDRLPLASGTYVQIDIADQGGGIPSEQLGKIFDPYFTTKASGTGLGLTTVYSIIKRHGGHISVTSELGYGTVFSLFLPVVEEMLTPQETNLIPQDLLTGAGRILLMDDEQIIRDLARFIFEEAGYQLVDCGDGAEAVEQYRLARELGVRFDAVILDLTVPGGMGGREAAELIRKLDPAAVLIVSSGYSNDPVMADYGRYGFSGSVVKPYTFEGLLTELSHAMEHARSV